MAEPDRAAFVTAMTTLAGEDLAGEIASAVAEAGEAEASSGAGLYWAISEICDAEGRIIFFDWKVDGAEFVWQLRRLADAHDVPPLGPDAADAAAAAVDKAAPDCMREMSAIGTALFAPHGLLLVWIETQSDAYAMAALRTEDHHLLGVRFCDGSAIERA